jgi:hypothetical protein
LVVKRVDSLETGSNVNTERMLGAGLELLDELSVVRLVKLENEFMLVAHGRYSSTELYFAHARI